MAWIFLRPFFRAYSNANLAILVEAFSVMIFRLSTTPGTTSCSSPEYKSSVFSRTITTSTPSKCDFTPGKFFTGRRFAYNSRLLRNATFTLGAPPAIAVAIGPFSATLFVRTDSIAAVFSTAPFTVLLSVFSARAPSSSHSIFTPVASKICLVAADTSGPIPSPGNNVTLWVMVHPILGYALAVVETDGQGSNQETKRFATQFHLLPAMLY